MNASNIKDTISTIAGIIFALASGLLTAAASGVTLPVWLVTAAGIAVALSGALIGFLTGKAPAGTKKTEDQVAKESECGYQKQNEGKPKEHDKS